jgi:ribosomal protein L34E
MSETKNKTSETEPRCPKCGNYLIGLERQRPGCRCNECLDKSVKATLAKAR